MHESIKMTDEAKNRILLVGKPASNFVTGAAIPIDGGLTILG
jgi:hypothetical protein